MWYKTPSTVPSNYHGYSQSEADHVTEAGRRLGHPWIIPLCYNHHRGSGGYSGNKKSWDTSFANQLELCRLLYQKLGLVMPEPQSKLRGRF